MNNEGGSRGFSQKLLWLVIGAIIMVITQRFFTPVIDSITVYAAHIWTPAIIATISPHPTAIQSVEAEHLLYHDSLDSFSTQQADWQRIGTSHSRCFFASDGYHVRITSSLAICHQKYKSYRDFNLTVDVVLNNNSGGVVLRDQAIKGQDGAYFFEISSEGKYRISVIPFINSPLIGWTSSSTIHRGNNIQNTLQVLAYKDTLRFYVNHVFLREIKNDMYFDGGISFACYRSGEAIFSDLDIFRS